MISSGAASILIGFIQLPHVEVFSSLKDKCGLAERDRRLKSSKAGRC